MQSTHNGKGFFRYAIAAVTGGLLVAGAALTAAQAYGGGHRGHGGSFGGGHHLQRMIDKVGVNDLQREQITAIVDASKPQFGELFKRMHESRKALKGSDPLAADYNATVAQQADRMAAVTRDMVTLRAQLRQDIWQVLDADQRIKAQEVMQEQREHKRKRWHGKKSES